jgi:chromosomal replication initiator protein
MKAWNNFLLQQEAELGVETVDKWLRSLKVIKFDAGNIHLVANDSFQALWFEEHIRPKALSKLFNNNGRLIKVHISVATEEAAAVTPKASKSKSTKKTTQNVSVPIFMLPFDELDPSCLFSQTAIGMSNELAAKILIGLSDSLQIGSPLPEAYAYNPIYIHGAKGSGKSHLLMATANALKSKGIKVVYCRAETFIEHVISAIRAGEMSAFRQAYREIDVLIVDDVQAFERKAATQEEFFHTFNTLHLAGKQIILSGNTPPSQLQSIEPRLTSRFEWGIVLPVGTQTRDELMLLLNYKASLFDYKLSPKMITFLLDTFNSNSKSLMQALQALILRTHMKAGKGIALSSCPTVQQAESLLSDLIAKETKAKLTPDKIVQEIAEHFGILPEDVLKKGQSRESVIPRQVAMYFCRIELKMPFTKIGQYFSKDHSTVMSSVKLVEAAINNQMIEISDPVKCIKRKIHE